MVCRQSDWWTNRAGPDVLNVKRSLRSDVRNPLVSLASAQRLAELPAEARGVLFELLEDLALDSRQRSDAAWAKRKPMMAAYWRAVSIYAKHATRLVR